MKPICLLDKRPMCFLRQISHVRGLLTIAIESSCDDTSVAVLEKHRDKSVTLHFHSKITSDSRSYGGVHPLVAHESHQRSLAGLIHEAIQTLPQPKPSSGPTETFAVKCKDGIKTLVKPDFVTATRGPGMRAGLITGIDTAKGLALAWQIPLVGVNHMQAHALTPRLVSALESSRINLNGMPEPTFPFLSLLVSGGHTMLAHSRSLCHHEILASTNDIPLGDMIDKSARAIIPASSLKIASDVMYGHLLESFTFAGAAGIRPSYTPSKSSIFVARDAAQHGYNWRITPPYTSPGPGGAMKYANMFSFSGIGSAVKRIMDSRPNIDDSERRQLAMTFMTVAFEHLASRVLFALALDETSDVTALVVSGGVASNQFLKTVLRKVLDTRGFEHLRLIFPPPKFCTDNAAMIAWTGMEMFEAGWTTDLSAMAMRKWSIDPRADDGGILGIDGWHQKT